jgi:hypothetical protein
MISLLAVLSCESRKDFKLSIKNTQVYATGGQFTISVESPRERYFQGKIIIDGTEVQEFQLSSSPIPKPSVIQFGIKDILDTNAIDSMIANNTLEANVTLFNYEKQIKLDTTIQFDFITPPIIYDLKVIEPTQFRVDKYSYNKKDFIKNLIYNGGHGVYNPNSRLLTTIFNDTSKYIKVSLTIDSAYDKAVIVRWPNPKNRSSNKYGDFQTVLKKYSESYQNIKDNKREMKGKYLVERELQLRYSGMLDYYLILFKNKDEYSFIKLFETIVDDVKPIHSISDSFSGDPRFEGSVYLTTKHFEGYSPYRVPFVGTVYGDVDKVYLEGIPINFNTGEEFYFKRSLNLDFGYNRLELKIIDKRGNVTKGFIPITMERVKDEKFKIENNIDINNN